MTQKFFFNFFTFFFASLKASRVLIYGNLCEICFYLLRKTVAFWNGKIGNKVFFGWLNQKPWRRCGDKGRKMTEWHMKSWAELWGKWTAQNAMSLPPQLHKMVICQCRGRKRCGLIPGSGRSPGGGHGNPSQHSCLENPMDRRAWRATAHRIAEESDTTEATAHTQKITQLFLLDNQKVMRLHSGS